MGGRRVLEIGKEGCQQESGIPEHLVTGSRQNMSRWGPSYLYPACHYQGPQSSPPQQATHSRSFFCFWSLLYPSPPPTNEEGGKEIIQEPLLPETLPPTKLPNCFPRAPEQGLPSSCPQRCLLLFSLSPGLVGEEE